MVTVRGLCVCVCVCVRVCVSVSAYSRTTGTKAAHEGYQRLQRNKRSKNIETGIVGDHVA